MQITNKKAVLIENNVQSLRRPFETKKYAEHNYTTMAELADGWLSIQQGQIKQSTYSNYHYHVYRHIIPALGNYLLADLCGEQIIEFVTDMHQNLSANTIKVILTTLKMVLKYGCKMELTDKKLLDYCYIYHHHAESRMLSQNDSMSMKKYLLQKTDAFSAGILLCRSTGIRVGELCGLKWGDINFSNDTFLVKRTVSRITNPNPAEGQPKTLLYIRSPKSFTSIREIPIPQYLIPRLWELRKSDECFVLTGTEHCTEPRNVQKRFKTILRHCEMQDCNFHALRHGFASACFENGNDCKTVSTILGHSSTKITMDIYIHTSLNQKKNCINSLL